MTPRTWPVDRYGCSLTWGPGQFPDVRADHGQRRKIIDAAFKMTKQLLGNSTQLAEKIVNATQDVVAETDPEGDLESGRTQY